MILIDFSNVAIGAILAFPEEIKLGAPKSDIENLIRHSILTTILSYKKKYRKEYGELVICIDSTRYWRKEVFPLYKANRKKSREDSTTDWDTVYSCISNMKSDIVKYLPYIVVEVDGAEGDDVIAALIKYSNKNMLIRTGLVESPEPNIIISSDKDFYQLHSYEGVKQFSPKMQKQVTEKFDTIKEGLIAKITKGDPGDGIPNIRSADNALVDKIRQLPITANMLKRFIELNESACSDKDELTRYNRNKTLIDFNYIPTIIYDNIVSKFLEPTVRPSKMDLLRYFQLNKCNNLIEHIEEF